jgi:EAL domain-containing protein (putative c-di-GMP-specific phosphodiesterase class I)
VTTASKKKSIVESVLSLARELGIAVVAEGIELEEDYRWLRMMDCQMGQGYYFSKPLAPTEATALVSQAQPRLGTDAGPDELLDAVASG